MAKGGKKGGAKYSTGKNTMKAVRDSSLRKMNMDKLSQLDPKAQQAYIRQAGRTDRANAREARRAETGVAKSKYRSAAYASSSGASSVSQSLAKGGIGVEDEQDQRPQPAPQPTPRPEPRPPKPEPHVYEESYYNPDSDW